MTSTSRRRATQTAAPENPPFHNTGVCFTNPHFADPFQPVACPGDCNLDGSVTVSELVAAIGISLDRSPLALCLGNDANGDGVVTIDELLRSVKYILNGCP